MQWIDFGCGIGRGIGLWTVRPTAQAPIVIKFSTWWLPTPKGQGGRKSSRNWSERKHRRQG